MKIGKSLLCFSVLLKLASCLERTCPISIRISPMLAQCPAPQFIPIHTTASVAPVMASYESHFMSFEEWKAINTPGDEIKQLGFAKEAQTTEAKTMEANIHEEASPAIKSANDTGTKMSNNDSQPERDINSYKERFNFASFDCAASILKSNPEAKGATAILKENKDMYMLNTCSAPEKYIIVELCNDILIDTVHLANFEYFSGVFREFRLTVAAKYPPGKEGWTELGVFFGRNSRDVQSFAVKNPLIWARYVRIELLNFYGSEFYCPLSLVRVYGKTMMEEYKQDEISDGDDLTHGKNQIQDVKTDSPPSLFLGLIRKPVSSSVEERIKLDPISLENTIIEVETSAPRPIFPYNDRLSTCPAFAVDPNRLLSQRADRMDEVSPSRVAYKAERHSVPDTARTTFSDVAFTALDGISKQLAPSMFASLQQSPPAPSPSTQESIFKQITKRLSLLEANATLSLKYIESQSISLASSFAVISKGQTSQLASFLEHINETLMKQTEILQEEYGELYVTATKDLERQRLRQEADMKAVLRQLAEFRSDVAYQRRMGLLQTVLVIVLLVFVGTTGGAGVDIHQQLTRALSRTSLGGNETPLGAMWKFRSRTSSRSESVTPQKQEKDHDPETDEPLLLGRTAHARHFSADLGQLRASSHTRVDRAAKSPLLRGLSRDDFETGLSLDIRRRLYRDVLP